MIKSVISNKENQFHRIHQQRVARKIINKIGKSTLNQSPIRKRVENTAQQTLEALSSYQTLCDNQQRIDLLKQPKSKINFTQQDIVGWDDQNQSFEKPQKLTTDSSVQTNISQEKARKSISQQTQRIKMIPRLIDIRQKTSKTPLRTTKITSPLIEYPTMQKFKLFFDKNIYKQGIPQLIICDRSLNAVDGLNCISFNNVTSKLMPHKRNHSLCVGNKINKVDIIKDITQNQ
ncbi:unnamed protein product (macronuclear) [Paramecium tetraurelia]|uniref:Rhodanese domain-containing protein n=1 Tax=Paramecium tetraurelia TaxID=5888 RepID=A0D8F8_PARTE|nr:uncharacterized protein GSPATT00014271001 [Paramecium tetraurelia]CAK79325.1 unnamed protein product [Paramecium tetraurelia]|eukprot:XP_001446722.1 hypothetical protein (macronuclear) [Paramecium tetraurelia strain d4-2]